MEDMRRRVEEAEHEKRAGKDLMHHQDDKHHAARERNKGRREEDSEEEAEEDREEGDKKHDNGQEQYGIEHKNLAPNLARNVCSGLKVEEDNP